MTYGTYDNINVSRSLLPSEMAPDFKSDAVVNGEFKECSLQQFKGNFLVLFFYPLDL